MSASVASKQKTVAPHEDAPPAADTCSSCQYAKPHAATDQFLFCRRHPPIPSVSNFHANFPIVSTGDWCGDFVALEEAVAVSPPVNVDVPYCSQSGETLSCTMGNWTNAPTSYAYAWLRDGDISIGTDSPTYEVAVEDAGHAVTCAVTASNAAGSGVAPPSNAVTIGVVTAGTLTSGPFTDDELAGLVGDISSNPTAWLGFDIDVDRSVITIRQQFPGVTTPFDICTRINALLEPAATMTFPDTAAPYTFVITSSSVGPTSIVSYASAPSYVVGGAEGAQQGDARKATTDISATLLLREVLGAVSVPGSDAASGAEDATDSVARSARGASAARSARTRNNRHK